MTGYLGTLRLQKPALSCFGDKHPIIMASNGSGSRHSARSAANARDNMDAPPVRVRLNPGVLLRKHRIFGSIRNGDKSAALRLVEKVASKTEAMRLVDFLLRNRNAITQRRHGRRLRQNLKLLDEVLARLVLGFVLHEVSSSTGRTPGLVTMATWLESATYLGRNAWDRRQADGVSPLFRTISALLESEPNISEQNPNLAQECAVTLYLFWSCGSTEVIQLGLSRCKMDLSSAYSFAY